MSMELMVEISAWSSTQRKGCYWSKAGLWPTATSGIIFPLQHLRLTRVWSSTHIVTLCFASSPFCLNTSQRWRRARSLLAQTGSYGGEGERSGGPPGLPQSPLLLRSLVSLTHCPDLLQCRGCGSGGAVQHTPTPDAGRHTAGK